MPAVEELRKDRCKETVASIVQATVHQVLLRDALQQYACEREASLREHDAEVERLRDAQRDAENKRFEAKSLAMIPPENTGRKGKSADDYIANGEGKLRHLERMRDRVRERIIELNQQIDSKKQTYAEVGDRWKHTHYTKDLPDDRLDALRANLATGRPPWAATTEEVAERLRALLAPHAALIAELSAVAYPGQVNDPIEALLTPELMEETRVALQAQRHRAWVAAVEGEVARVAKETLVTSGKDGGLRSGKDGGF